MSATTLHTSYHELKMKNGNRRIWLEGEPLLRAGFTAGQYYTAIFDIENICVKMVLLKDFDPLSAAGKAAIKAKSVFKISRRQMTDWVKPIVDLCNASVTAVFGDFCRFRSQALDGEVVFAVHPDEMAQAKRETSLLRNLRDGVITKGDAFLGIGISADANREGFAREGIAVKQKWAVELESRYLDIAARNNPQAYLNTHLICGKIEEVETHLLAPVNCFSFSMECTNYSRAGVAKKGLTIAEEGDGVTSLFGVVATIRATNPAIMFSENVVEARNSASYILLKKELIRLNYNYIEFVLNQSHSGALERRVRYWLVIYSKGLNVNVNGEMPTIPMQYKRVGEIMDDNTADSAWFPLSNLQKRHDINVAAGRGFSLTLVDENSTSVNTIPRNYSKHQLSNPHVVSDDGKQYRLFSKKEHAKLKLVPPHLVDHASETVANEGLGQGIVYLHGVQVVQWLLRNLSLNSEQNALALSA